jgi:hypothetical protein
MAHKASAETTHRFIQQLTFPELSGGITPIGVDKSGNIIVWAEETATVRKYSPNGAPVDFSALGTNVLDGEGGTNCPATSADCDRTPIDGLGPNPNYNQRQIAAAVDQSNGPTAGYIYVSATQALPHERWQSHIYVFDPSGEYLGEVDQSQATPIAAIEEIPPFISVSPSGALVVAYYTPLAQHLDRYEPNTDPSKDVFVGQLRRGGIYYVAADDRYTYVSSYTFAEPQWAKYDNSAYALPSGEATPIDFSSNHCGCAEAGPWGNGGRNDEDNNNPYQVAAVDPANHDVYLLDEYGGMIAQWSEDNQRIGQEFGGPEVLNPLAVGQKPTRTMAFDTSGTATDGRIYVENKSNGIAVFGPPVPLPEVDDIQATMTHTGAHVTANVNLNHGPQVSNCKIQWGQVPQFGLVNYSENSVPCEPAVPYAQEETAIDADITGLETERDYSFRIVVRTLNGTTKTRGNEIRPPAVLGVSTEPATGVTRTSATMNGRLDADGMPTEYWFEYGIDTNYRNSTAHESAGEGASGAPVGPIEIENLQSGRTYHFRLVAENPLGTTYGPDQPFDTAAPPSVFGAHASDVAETSATLHAQIDSGGYATTYRFEYGTSPEYGNRVPATDASVGSGGEPVAVSADLENLERGVTYHFRVVATNEWGTTETEDTTFNFFPQNCPNEYVRQVTGSAYLPDCRAYELVSPGDAGAVELLPGDTLQDFRFFSFPVQHVKTPAPNLGTAEDPARFGFLGAIGAVTGTNPTNTVVDMYTATRGIEGWKTTHWGLNGNEAALVGSSQCNFDMSVCIDYRIADYYGKIGSGDPYDNGSLAPYVWNARGESLGRWPTNLGEVANAEEYLGEDKPSPDLSHFIFSSRNIAFAENGLTHAPGSVYDNDIGEATVQIVSKLDGGEDIPQDTGTETESIQIPAVSNDGSHVLMSTLGTGGVHLYMRVNDATTYEIAPGRNVKFIAMTEDGSKVFFSSREHITPDDTDSGTDIFKWNQATNEITKITQGNGEGNSDACNAEATSYCSATPIEPERPDIDNVIASQAGDFYFYSPEQLDPENPGVYNAKNLYVYRDGGVKYVATLDAGTAINRMQISPKGDHAAFLTAARLTSYDNEGWREMYTFDPETGAIRCASCNPSGEPPQIVRPPLDPNKTGINELNMKPSADVMASQSGPFMSNDGRVAFATSDALVESDTNGQIDVYEFVDGRPQLITSGTSKDDTYSGNFLFPAEPTGLEAISNDGVDIYFSTFDTLTSEDLNGEFVKFYDARTGGGFVPNPVKLPCAAADECHGGENQSPGPAQIGTEATLGASGNALSTPARGARHKHRGRAHRKHRARHPQHRAGHRRHRHG